MTLLIIILIIDALVGLWIGHGKGRDLEGFLLGLGLGMIGWIITAFLSPGHDVLVRREVARQAVAHDAASIIATPLDGMSMQDVQGLSASERRAYVKTGTVPARLSTPGDDAS